MRSQNLMKFNHCLFKLLRKTQTQELACGHYFSIINVHLVDINMFTKFHEIPSLPFKDIENPKRRERRMETLTNGRTWKKYPPPSPPPLSHAQFAGGGIIEDFKLWWNRYCFSCLHVDTRTGTLQLNFIIHFNNNWCLLPGTCQM